MNKWTNHLPSERDFQIRRYRGATPGSISFVGVAGPTLTPLALSLQ